MLKKLFKKTNKNVAYKNATKIEILNTQEVNKIIGGADKNGLERAQDDLQRTVVTGVDDASADGNQWY